MQPGPKPTRDCGSPPSTSDRKNSHITTSPRQDTPQSWASCHWRRQKERHCTDFPGTENFLVKESNKTHDWGVKTLPMNDSKQHCLHVRYHYQELKISSFIMNKKMPSVFPVHLAEIPFWKPHQNNQQCDSYHFKESIFTFLSRMTFIIL